MFKRKKQQITRNPNTDPKRAGVFSYHASRTRPEVDRGRTESLSQSNESNSRIKHIPSLIALIVIMVSIFYATLLDTNNPSVVPLVQANSNSILRTNSVYQEGISDILTDSVFNKSKLMINTSSIASQIKEKYTELGSVAVTIPIIGKRPVVQISPASPVLTITSQHGEYVISDEGRVLLKASDLQNVEKLGLVRVNDTLGVELEPGKYVLPKATVEFILSIKYQFTQKGLVIESVSLPAIANELHVKVKDQPYVIKFNLQNDVLQQVGSYFAVVESLKDKPQPAEYIDVRIDGRVYYK